MREMTNNAKLLCRIQAELFANYDSFSHCSPYFFIRRFMYSNLAKRFDDISVLGEISTIESFIDEIDEQFGKTTFGKRVDVSKEVLYWTGFMYRYFAYRYEISSQSLFQRVQPKLFFERYKLYHSMDPDYVIERIIEEEKIDLRTPEQIVDLIQEYAKFLEEKNKTKK